MLSVLLLLVGRVRAQSYTTSSSHRFYFSGGSDSVIVRNWNDTAVFTCSHHPGNNQYSHIIHMRYSISPTVNVVKIPIFQNEHGGMIDRINDMRIIDNKCYFCGSRVKNVGEELVIGDMGNYYWQILYDTCGLMGYFEFSNSLILTGNLYMYEIPKVKSAERMAVYHSGVPEITQVDLLCKYCGTTRTMCLADMRNTLADPNYWEYDIVVPSDANEIMTDVTATSTHVVLASVFKNDRKIVAFRQKRIGMGIFRFIPWEALYRYKYDISGYSEECFSYGFKRVEKAPVILCPKSNGFVAGVSADYDNNVIPEQRDPKLNPSILLFDMRDVSNMNEYQAVSAGAEPLLKELTYLPLKNSVAILYNFKRSVLDDSAYTVLQFPVLDTVPECEMYYDTLIRKAGGMIQSIDTYRGHSASLGALLWQGLTPLDGIQRQYDRSNSCFLLYDEGGIERRPVLEHESEEKQLLHEYDELEAICVFSSAVETVENVTIICSH